MASAAQYWYYYFYYDHPAVGVATPPRVAEIQSGGAAYDAHLALGVLSALFVAVIVGSCATRAGAGAPAMQPETAPAPWEDVGGGDTIARRCCNGLAFDLYSIDVTSPAPGPAQARRPRERADRHSAPSAALKWSRLVKGLKLQKKVDINIYDRLLFRR